ncbi:MAG: hypothetical protein HWE14_08340 [Flavobacteriia bacterium]|nr:hypothetical protein [Flavobacteriia bacterium]
MKRIQKVIQEITALTFEIEQKYPALYQHLDENPMTLQSEGKVDVQVLSEYRDGLMKQMEDFRKSH